MRQRSCGTGVRHLVDLPVSAVLSVLSALLCNTCWRLKHQTEFSHVELSQLESVLQLVWCATAASASSSDDEEDGDSAAGEIEGADQDADQQDDASVVPTKVNLPQLMQIVTEKQSVRSLMLEYHSQHQMLECSSVSHGNAFSACCCCQANPAIGTDRRLRNLCACMSFIPHAPWQLRCVGVVSGFEPLEF